MLSAQWQRTAACVAEVRHQRSFYSRLHKQRHRSIFAAKKHSSKCWFAEGCPALQLVIFVLGVGVCREPKGPGHPRLSGLVLRWPAQFPWTSVARDTCHSLKCLVVPCAVDVSQTRAPSAAHHQVVWLHWVRVAPCKVSAEL